MKGHREQEKCNRIRCDPLCHHNAWHWWEPTAVVHKVTWIHPIVLGIWSSALESITGRHLSMYAHEHLAMRGGHEETCFEKRGGIFGAFLKGGPIDTITKLWKTIVAHHQRIAYSLDSNFWFNCLSHFGFEQCPRRSASHSQAPGFRRLLRSYGSFRDVICSLIVIVFASEACCGVCLVPIQKDCFGISRACGVGRFDETTAGRRRATPVGSPETQFGVKEGEGEGWSNA